MRLSDIQHLNIDFVKWSEKDCIEKNFLNMRTILCRKYAATWNIDLIKFTLIGNLVGRLLNSICWRPLANFFADKFWEFSLVSKLHTFRCWHFKKMWKKHIFLPFSVQMSKNSLLKLTRIENVSFCFMNKIFYIIFSSLPKVWWKLSSSQWFKLGQVSKLKAWH